MTTTLRSFRPPGPRRGPHGAWTALVLVALTLASAGCSPALASASAAAPPSPGDSIAAAVSASTGELARASALPTDATAPIRRAAEPDPRETAEREAAAVFRAMHADVLACYAKRLATHPHAHAAITVDVLVGRDGRPREVATTGGAALGPAALSCVERRVRRAEFAPARDGGTSRVRVPFAFHPDVAGGD